MSDAPRCGNCEPTGLDKSKWQLRKEKWTDEYREKRKVADRQYYYNNRDKDIARLKARVAKTREAVRSIKESHGCCVCGERDGVVLDFLKVDKSDPGYTMSGLAHCRVDTIVSRMAMKIIICCNCRERRLAPERAEFRTGKTGSQKSKYSAVKSVLSQYKAESGCVRCGERDPIVLQFHHVNPSEKMACVSKLATYSLRTVLEEVKKCIVMCANCHRREHSCHAPKEPDK